MHKHLRHLLLLRVSSTNPLKRASTVTVTTSNAANWQDYRQYYRQHRILYYVGILGLSGLAALLLMNKRRNDKRGSNDGSLNAPSDRVRSSLAKCESISSQQFVAFASMEHDNQPLMTPNDFIDAMIQDQPRPRIRTKILNDVQVQQLLANTPHIKEVVHKKRKGVKTRDEVYTVRNVNPTFLRSLGDRGIVTYREYLFLLSLLARSKEALKVAYDLIDLNGDDAISRDDFAKFCLKASSHSEGTSLTRHLFGADGKQRLSFADFSAFICNIQREILHAEFAEFSRGLELISARDFADLLLRYTDLNEQEKADYEARLDRRLSQKEAQIDAMTVNEAENDTIEDANESNYDANEEIANENSNESWNRVSGDQLGVSFEETLTFFELLQALDAFAYAFGLAAFERAGSQSRRPLTKDEFSRAAKICTGGKTLSPLVVDILFALFDKADDGCLSYDEFFAVLSNRLKRRCSPRVLGGWQGFKKCVSAEMRNNVASRHVNAY